jgi:hypothetical protein
MMQSTSIASLLDSIVDIGDRLFTAIKNREMEEIQDCLEERSELLVALTDYEDSEAVVDHSEWLVINEKLSRQHERIRKAFQEYREAIKRELEEVSDYREAQSAYSESPEKPSGQIINRKVQG